MTFARDLGAAEYSEPVGGVSTAGRRGAAWARPPPASGPTGWSPARYHRAVRILGLMSGTSADGVDAALVEWPDQGDPQPFRLIAYRERSFEAELQARIHRLAAAEVPGKDALAELAALDTLLADRFAEAALELLREAGVPVASVRAVASHGQTVAHHPEAAASLQIGDPSRLAQRVGLPVVADFRARDLAAGGEGAPLAPFFHWAALRHAEEPRAVLNLGGIANLTGLPAAPEPDGVRAFDVGPANSLLDGVVRIATGGAERIDREGARAARGRVDAALLARLLDDDYLRRPPPKSTGRERYGSAMAEDLWWEAEREGRGLDDLLATLVRAVAEAVARAVGGFLSEPVAPRRLLVCGGGARNPTVMAALADALPGVGVEPTDAHGVPGDAVEAMAFSLMGRNAVLGLPNHLPACTGARQAVVLGERIPGPDGRI